VEVREIAAPSAGNKDFLADALGTLQHDHAPPAFAGLDCAKQSGGARPKNQSIKLMRQKKSLTQAAEFHLRNYRCRDSQG
jgi:hypothetical protein